MLSSAEHWQQPPSTFNDPNFCWCNGCAGLRQLVSMVPHGRRALSTSKTLDAAMQRIPLVKGDYAYSTTWKFYLLGLLDLESFVHKFEVVING